MEAQTDGQSKGIMHITQGARLAGESLKQTFSHYNNLFKRKTKTCPDSFDSLFFPQWKQIGESTKKPEKKGNILNEV